MLAAPFWVCASAPRSPNARIAAVAVMVTVKLRISPLLDASDPLPASSLDFRAKNSRLRY
jgi:hypothetical protein